MEKPTRILVPLDGSPLATKALDHALAVFPEAEITVLNIVVPLDIHMSEGGILSPDEELHEQERERAERIIEAAKRRALDHDTTVTATTEEGSPVDTIIEFINDNNIDHIVMGSHGRSDLTQILLGSVAGAVVKRSPVPITVIH